MLKITHPTVHLLDKLVSRINRPDNKTDVRATMTKFAKYHPPAEFKELEIPVYTEKDVRQFLLNGVITK